MTGKPTAPSFWLVVALACIGAAVFAYIMAVVVPQPIGRRILVGMLAVGIVATPLVLFMAGRL